MAEEGKYRWVNGKTANGIPWDSGEPNNLDGNEHCIVVHKSNGKFNDLPCDSTCYFLCQKN